MENIVDLEIQFEHLFDELVRHQQAKVLKIAQLHLPHVTQDDIMNPNDFPVLMADPIFNYEDGLASGLVAAQIAVRARLFCPIRESDDRERSNI